MKFAGAINHYKADTSGWIGATIMFAFALFAGYRWHTSGLIFFGVLVVRDLAASWFLITRTSDRNKKKFNLIEALAYFSSAFPLIYLKPLGSLSQIMTVSSILAIVGFTISTIALFDLGSSFGISPANRGVVRAGLYKYFRHPMYTGYVISELGFIFLNPINLILWTTSAVLYFIRVKFEEKVLVN